MKAYKSREASNRKEANISMDTSSSSRAPVRTVGTPAEHKQ